ncbi:MAG: tetratricopeptide repeat protein [Cyanobacteria bacterium P01_A01_bin.116]
MTLEPGQLPQHDNNAEKAPAETFANPSADRPSTEYPPAKAVSRSGENSPESASQAQPSSDRLQRALSKLNNSEKKAEAKAALALGQATFERGRYKRAIAHFQTAIAFANPIGALGGEIQMWLVNAYIAAGDNEEGLALCRKLIRHPDLDTKQQSKRLLYILEAPELEMNPEWVTKIPDLTDLEDGQGKKAYQKPKKPRRRKPKPEPEPLDLSQVNTEDNQFIWVGLVGILLTFLGLAWFY